MSYIGNINVNGTAHLVGSTLYGVCNTPADESEKIVVCSDFDKLLIGVTIHVKFKYSNTSESKITYLNVNNIKSIRIYRYGTTSVGTDVSTSWEKESVVSFTYDGNYWIMNDAVNNDARYITRNEINDTIDSRVNDIVRKTVYYGTCETLANTYSKKIKCNDFNKLVTGDIIYIKFTNGNTADSPALSINNTTGEIKIRLNDIDKLNPYDLTSWEAGSIVSFTYDGEYWIMNSTTSTAGKSVYGKSFTYNNSQTNEEVTKPGRQGAEIFNDYRNNKAIGEYSIAMGRMNTSVGICSFSAGLSNTVYGESSVAMGKGNTINGDYSITIGNSNTATGNYSVAMGKSNNYDPDITSGENSIAMGYMNTSSGESSVAMGRSNTAKREYSVAMGKSNTSVGMSSFSAGNGNTTNGESSVAMGKGNTTNKPYSVTIGNGNTTNGESSVAMGKGNIASGLYSFAVGNNNNPTTDSNPIVSGESSVAMGYSNKAIGNYSVAIGRGNTSVGMSSFSAGDSNTTNGESSVAMGKFNTTDGDYSITIGNRNTTEKDRSIAIGTYCNTLGSRSFAIGYYASSNGENMVLGYYNKTPELGSSTSKTGDLFIIGNGKSSTLTSNALRIDWAGNVMATKEYTAQGADYAEMFEWLDGNPDNEDRVGMFVTLEGKKIRIANHMDDYILGVVSATPSVVANAHTDAWCDKYLRDEFGRIISDENGEWKVNPNFREEDNNSYVSRLDRKEWSAIGMLGVLCVRQDGTAQVNGYVSVNDDGIAISCGKNAISSYRVIDVKSKDVCMIVFR